MELTKKNLIDLINKLDLDEKEINFICMYIIKLISGMPNNEEEIKNISKEKEVKNVSNKKGRGRPKNDGNYLNISEITISELFSPIKRRTYNLEVGQKFENAEELKEKIGVNIRTIKDWIFRKWINVKMDNKC